MKSRFMPAHMLMSGDVIKHNENDVISYVVEDVVMLHGDEVAVWCRAENEPLINRHDDEWFVV